MSRKTICWVTPDWFADVDIPIVPYISNEYDVTWIIVFPWRNNRFKEEDFDKYRDEKHLDIRFIHSKYYRYDPRILSVYQRIKKIVKAVTPDVVYFNIVPENPLIYPLYSWLSKRLTIFTAHDGSIKSIMSPLTKRMFAKCYSHCRYVNMFSESQANLFRINYPGPKVFVIPLAVKDFGLPNVELRNDCISFVSFGSIHQEKNIPLVIEAANQLYEEGICNFKISINGRWLIAEQPEQLIRYPEIFELNTKMIPNSDIPNLFANNHYAIYAYKQMSQSGALKVAFNYTIPVIVSDLPGFIDEVEEGVNGMIFHSEDVESLKYVMLTCINRSPQEYQELKEKMKIYVDSHFSIEALTEKYKQMFNTVLQKI